MPWEKACRIDEIGNGTPKRAVLKEIPLLLARVEGELKAYSDVCMHRGASLSQSTVDKGIVTCPAHFWQFDLHDGRCVQVPSAALKAFNLKTEKDEVYVEI